MNKAMRKFLRLLKKEHTKLDQELTTKIEKSLEPKMAMFKNPLEFAKNQEMLEDAVYSELGTTEEARFMALHDTEDLINKLEGINGFNDFVTLQDYMDKFRFTKDEQALVLAAVINHNINYFMQVEESFQKTQAETSVEPLDTCCDIILTLEEAITKALGQPSIITKHPNIGKIIKEKMANVFVSAKELRKLITEDANINAFLDASSFIPVINGTRQRMSDYQISLVLQASEKKYQMELEEKQKKDKMCTVKAVVKPNVEDIAKSNKARRSALQELKQYLTEDLPIRYLSEDEIIKLTNLLYQAGYTDNQIMFIQKAIIENNNRIAAETRAETLIASQTRYLSVEEIEILNSANALITDSAAVINPIYQRILSNVELVNDQLLMFHSLSDEEDPAFNDDAELMLLAIEELREDVVAYQYSAYHLLRKNNQ